jgi:putative DNA primase/helicase
VLRAALVYASWGWHVHPLRPGDKRPLLSNWPQRATTDADAIRRWWGRWPQANIGLACGPSRLLAIDLDVKAGVDGLAAWEALKAQLGFEDGGTPVSNTPSGGRHLLFALGDHPAPGNTAGKLGPGIDTRGDGGYIVLPPSRLSGPAARSSPQAGGSSAQAERSSPQGERSSAQAERSSPQAGGSSAQAERSSPQAGGSSAQAERSSPQGERSSAAGTWAWQPEAHPRNCRPQPLPEALWARLVAGATQARRPATGSRMQDKHVLQDRRELQAGRVSGDRRVLGDRRGRAPGEAAGGAPGHDSAGGSPGVRRPDRLEGVTAYAKAAVRDEARQVAMAPQGTRNDTLNRAAFSLGQLVAGGLLDPSQVERPLLLGARLAGLGPEEAAATVRSGLNAGQQRPRVPRPGLTGADPSARPGLDAVQPPASPHLGAVQPPPGSKLNCAQPLGQAGPVSPQPHPGRAQNLATDDGAWLLSLPADDEGHAQCVARLHGDRFLYCPAYGWKQYAGSHWVPDPEGLALRAAIIEVLKARQRLALQVERTALARVATRSNRRIRSIQGVLAVLLAVDAASFDASPDHLNVANGLLDLRTGDLVPHDPSQRVTYCLKVAYEPGTDYGPWRDWLRATVAPRQEGAAGDGAPTSCLPGEAEEFYLQLAVGYSLTGHTSEEVLFYLYGPPRSGKGTFTEALLALLGPEPLAAEVHFGTFVRSRNHDANSADLARLKPCRLLVSSEPNRDDWLNSGELKRLTGGNLVFAAFKFRDHFSYRPTYKIWLAGNQSPRADADDDALWSRLRVIPFPHSHLGHEDRGLKARMKSPEMQRQILAWAVDGARAWYQTTPRGLPTPPSVEAATQAARRDLDYVGQWLAERVEVTEFEEDFVPSAALQASYEGWRQQAGAPACSVRALTQALKAKGLPAGTQRWHAGRNLRGCAAIRLSG